MNEIVQSLGNVSDLWLNASHPLRKETIQALQVSTGLSSHQIDLALRNAFTELTTDKLKAFANSKLKNNSNQKSGTVLHVLPANAFTAWLPGAVISALLGHHSLLKASVREPVFAQAWKRSVEEVDPALAKAFEIVSWKDDLLNACDAVLAYGSDETLNRLRSKTPSTVRFVGYGHKLSVGIIFEEALMRDQSEGLLARVRADVEPFRLQGCLSPQVLYIENPQYTRWPELESVVDVAPRFQPFVDSGAAIKELSKFSPYLSCVGYAGSPQRGEYLKEELAGLGVSRICPIGEMQRPPLDWANSGIDLVNLLH